jgi:hypothetical protein
VADAAGRSGFILEALEETRLVEQLAEQNLERHGAVADGNLLGEINGAHAALAQAAHHAKTAPQARGECGVNLGHGGDSSARHGRNQKFQSSDE